MTLSALTAPVFLAFQLWDGFGWAAQGVFTWRMLHQWVASEKQGRTVLPASFWTWSLIGSVLDVVYLLHRRDPVFLSGALITACIFGRNFWMARRPAPASPPERAAVVPAGSRRPWLPIAAGLGIFAAVVIEALGPDHGLVHFERRPAWLIVGFLGTLGWTLRFVIQWWESERRAVSHLPPSFFYVGLVAAALLFAYAISQVDWVKMVAFGLTLVPYGRNVLLTRRRRTFDEAEDRGDSEPPAPAPVGGTTS